jgi:hypothetical protein
MNPDEFKRLDDIFNRTLELISLYQQFNNKYNIDGKDKLSIPFALKGNIGELMTMKELRKKFPEHEIDYKGVASRGIDICIDNKVNIEVKTQYYK